MSAGKIVNGVGSRERSIAGAGCGEPSRRGGVRLCRSESSGRESRRGASRALSGARGRARARACSGPRPGGHAPAAPELCAPSNIKRSVTPRSRS